MFLNGVLVDDFEVFLLNEDSRLDCVFWLVLQVIVMVDGVMFNENFSGGVLGLIYQIRLVVCLVLLIIIEVMIEIEQLMLVVCSFELFEDFFDFSDVLMGYYLRGCVVEK